MATEKDVKKKDSYELMSLLIYEISGCKFCTAVMARSIVHARLCMSTLLLLTLSLKKNVRSIVNATHHILRCDWIDFYTH
jgi:hypothetical protein